MLRCVVSALGQLALHDDTARKAFLAACSSDRVVIRGAVIQAFPETKDFEAVKAFYGRLLRSDSVDPILVDQLIQAHGADGRALLDNYAEELAALIRFGGDAEEQERLKAQLDALRKVQRQWEER
jgi:hypothetical protein